jgi:hypothetical protein
MEHGSALQFVIMFTKNCVISELSSRAYDFFFVCREIEMNIQCQPYSKYIASQLKTPMALCCLGKQSLPIFGIITHNIQPAGNMQTF